MKISLKWLSDFVDVKEFFQKPEPLADVLTRGGLEVEEITNRGRDFQDVVVGLILEKDKHANADKLSVCRVTTGEGVVHQIVCGAQNHKANDRVIVALPGAILPGNFEIKKAVVRGVESGGMLCSLKELGLAKESEGIAILPEDAPIGKPFAAYQGLDDVTFELKVTANRADCLSHWGLAREVSCLLGRPLKLPESKLVSINESSKSKVALDVKVPDLCPRYTGIYIQGVKVGESPSWIKQRLESVGLNSINNVVDATNYVMLEMGQPLHAFDAGQVQGAKIVVDRSSKGEKFTTLDGTELTLTGEELMIKDSVRSVCMAGVVGGKNSGVSDGTQNIFLEAAYFTPQSVRKSMRSHGLNTDSGYRFARGVDPEGTMNALHRAAALIQQLAGGDVFGEPHDFYPTPQKKQAVSLSLETVSKRLGYEAQATKLEDYLKRLGCAFEKAESSYKITPPSFRFDLEIDMDLVEEYARLNGYDQIPETVPQNIDLIPTAHDAVYMGSIRAGAVLRGQGFSQAMNSVFTGQKGQGTFLKNGDALTKAGLPLSPAAVHVLNPLNEEQNVLRQTLSFGLFKNLQGNYHQGNEFGRLFEIGKVFQFKAAGEYQENWRLGFVAWGHSAGLWTQTAKAPVVFEVKAAIEALLRSLQINSFQWATIKEKGDVPSFLHSGQNAHLIVEGKSVGFVGTIHPVLLEESKVRVDGAFAEIDFEVLLKGQPRVKRTESLSRFPSVQRDLALVMKQSLRVGDVMQLMKKEAGPILQSVDVFDVYQGDKLEAGQKSVAFRLIYQDKKDTLRDQVVNDSIQKILDSLKQNFEISVR